MINHMKLRQIRELIGIHEVIIDAENEKKDIRKSEIGLLKDFLYEAVFVPERVEAPPRDIVERPELRVYTDDFGMRKGDNCLVAELGGAGWSVLSGRGSWMIMGMWMMRLRPVLFHCITNTEDRESAHSL